MNIVMLAENDPSGTAVIFAAAVNLLTPHRCRVITWQRRYVCDFPTDLHLPDLPVGSWDLVGEMLRSADVVHFHMTADESRRLGPFELRDIMRGKTVVRHHHGEPALRENLAKYRRRYEVERPGDVLLVSTPDMLDLFPPGRAEWLANVVPLESPLYAPTTPDEWAAREGQPLRICQSPTRKGIKSTAALLATGHNVDVVEWQAHAEVMRRKRLADVVFDQMDFSFGMSSLEGLALGKPTICRLDALQQARIAEYAGCDVLELPWINVRDAAELRTTLDRLAEDARRGRQEIKRIGVRSRQFMEHFWPEAKAAARLSSAYERACA